MIDGIDLIRIPLTIEKIRSGEPITQREHRGLLDYLEEFPEGLYSKDAKDWIGKAKVSEPEPMPTPEELEEILEEVKEQEKKPKGKRKK